VTANFPQQKKVLLLGDYRHSLTVIRSLSGAGYQVIAGRTDPASPYGKHSRFTSEVWDHPAAEGSGESFIAAVEEFLNARKDVSLVFPIGDNETAALARNISRIPAGAKVVMPAPRIVTTCHKKMEMCKIIERLKIPQVKFKKVSDLPELKEVVAEIGYPCIIRPADQFTRIFNEKVFICRTSKTIDEDFKHWPGGENPLIVQEYVSGPRHNFYFLAEKGELITGVEVKILRTDRLDGTGLAVDSVSVAPSASVLDACRKLLKYFNYTGLGCAQFLVDEGGEVKCFLEINPRLGAAFVLPYYCGVDFPKMAVDLAQGRSFLLSANNLDYSVGVRFGWLYGDIQGLRSATGYGQTDIYGTLRWLGRLVSTFSHAKVHPTWSFADPMPTIRVYSKMVSSLFPKISS